MTPGEYAVHYSMSVIGVDAAACTVLPSLAAAETYARKQVLQHPSLQCRIFDHHGFVGAPALEINGSDFRRRGEITSRFRRWVGSVLFFGGSAMFITDWVAGFHYDWPSVLGSRLIIPGLVLLVTEGLVMLHARREEKQSAPAVVE